MPGFVKELEARHSDTSVEFFDSAIPISAHLERQHLDVMCQVSQNDIFLGRVQRSAHYLTLDALVADSITREVKRGENAVVPYHFRDKLSTLILQAVGTQVQICNVS